MCVYYATPLSLLLFTSRRIRRVMTKHTVKERVRVTMCCLMVFAAAAAAVATGCQILSFATFPARRVIML